jgi:nicotinamide mononucleotide transporter
MSQIFDWLFQQYEDTSTLFITLELIGVLFGFLSVWFSKQDNILVFPTGIVSTAIFVYILLVNDLLGDMMINAYYFAMSVYGWFIWTRKVDDAHFIPITIMTKKETQRAVLLFIASMIFVVAVYQFSSKWGEWYVYIDVLTTGIFFVGMWLMAKKKVENWIFWIVGDMISVPLYIFKGLLFTSFQYLIFTLIAFYGYKAWKKQINLPKSSLLK